MEIKGWLTDKNGKATHIEWENGSKSPIPFYVKFGVSEFDSVEGYRDYLNGLLGDYEWEREQTIDADEPVPSMYPNHEQFETRHKIWEQKEALKEFKKETEPPPPPPYIGRDGFRGLPPDEHATERIKLFQDKRDWEAKLQEAKDRGDANSVDRAKFFIRQTEKDLQRIPESMFQTQVKGDIEVYWTNVINKLFDPKSDKNSSVWGTERMNHDIEDAIRNFNDVNTSNTIVLPLEAARGTGRTGRYKLFKPGNFVHVTFNSKEEKDEFSRYVKGGGDPHEFVRGKFGIDFDKLDEGKKLSLKELEKVPEKQTQLQYEVRVSTGKLYKDEDLRSLTREQVETLIATKEWPASHPPDFSQEAESEPVTAENFEQSLKPYEPRDQLANE